MIRPTVDDIGRRVYYTPSHAKGPEDREYGRISSLSKYRYGAVFVRFGLTEFGVLVDLAYLDWDAGPASAQPVTLGGIMTDRLLQFFQYAHLPPNLQEVSQPFCTLAYNLVESLPSNPERTVALRKLLEAKDCAVRALLFKDQ